MTTTTKAQLEARIAELEAILSAPAAEASPLQRRKANADSTTVGIITGVYPVQRRDNSVVDGGFRVRVRIGAQVNFGTAEEPQRRRVPVETVYFTVWDEPNNMAGTQIRQLMDTCDWACVRLFWEYSGNPRSVQTKELTNPNTGRVYRETSFAYAPDKRVFAFDLLSKGGQPQAPAEDLSLPPIPHREPEPLDEGDIPF
jgi:hypothetical protein